MDLLLISNKASCLRPISRTFSSVAKYFETEADLKHDHRILAHGQDALWGEREWIVND